MDEEVIELSDADERADHKSKRPRTLKQRNGKCSNLEIKSISYVVFERALHVASYRTTRLLQNSPFACRAEIVTEKSNTNVS